MEMSRSFDLRPPAYRDRRERAFHLPLLSKTCNAAFSEWKPKEHQRYVGLMAEIDRLGIIKHKRSRARGRRCRALDSQGNCRVRDQCR